MHEPPLVLIIDDSADFLEIISVRLRAAGFEVMIAINASAGKEIALNKKPDIVLLDVNMPGTNGTEALLDFKEDSSLAGLKVAILTSMDLPWPGIKNKEKFAKEIGAVAFFDKATDLDDIANRVAELLKT